jgi:hypothetical protein
LIGDDELLHERALAGPRTEQPPYRLDMLAFPAGTADDDRDIGVRDVEPLVETCALTTARNSPSRNASWIYR